MRPGDGIDLFRFERRRGSACSDTPNRPYQKPCRPRVAAVFAEWRIHGDFLSTMRKPAASMAATIAGARSAAMRLTAFGHNSRSIAASAFCLTASAFARRPRWVAAISTTPRHVTEPMKAKLAANNPTDDVTAARVPSHVQRVASDDGSGFEVVGHLRILAPKR